VSKPSASVPIGAPTYRTATAVLFFGLAAISAGSTLRGSWPLLSGQPHGYYSKLTRGDPNAVPRFQSLLPDSVVRFFSARVRPGEGYYVQVPDGVFIPGVDYPTAVRTFARFELLPAVEVQDPREADVVLSIGADPGLLGLRYERVERTRDGRYALAWVLR
jgi:hypothetical protein